MYLLPLENGKFAKFGNREIYYLVTEDQREHRKLLPNVEDHIFVHDICNTDPILQPAFSSYEFKIRYSIKKFNVLSLARLLAFELRQNRIIPNWDPKSQNIPNEIWLDKIWEFILKSNANLNMF